MPILGLFLQDENIRPGLGGGERGGDPGGTEAEHDDIGREIDVGPTRYGGHHVRGRSVKNSSAVPRNTRFRTSAEAAGRMSWVPVAIHMG